MGGILRSASSPKLIAHRETHTSPAHIGDERCGCRAALRRLGWFSCPPRSRSEHDPVAKTDERSWRRDCTHAVQLRLNRAGEMNTEEVEAMRQTLWSVLIVSIVCAVSVGLVAQAPGSSAAQAGKQVTFSGCVEKAP